MLRPASIFVSLLMLSSDAAFPADRSFIAPIPKQISAGKRVFVSNMGGECQDFTSPGLSFGAGQPLRHGQVSAAVPTAYDGIYSALSAWGRFGLVGAPADADLIFQIRVVCPSIQEGHPVLELQILDPKTRVALWGFNEIADPAELQKHRDANFERALSRLIDDLKGLLARADAAPVR